MQEKDLLAKLNELLVVEEGFLRQKSRIKWLQVGDQNTGYFHQVIRGRLSRNTIKTLTANDGSILSDDFSIQAEILRHYETLLGSVLLPVQKFFSPCRVLCQQHYMKTSTLI